MIGKLVITMDGLRQLIKDLHVAGHKPAALLISEFDKRELKQEIKAKSKQHSPESERADADKAEVGFISGIPIVSHKDVRPGQARVVLRTDIADRNRDVLVK